MIVISAHKIVMPPQIAVLRPWSAAASFPLPILKRIILSMSLRLTEIDAQIVISRIFY